MSVLRAKRTTSKAEFVNTANAIYIETLNFLTRMSARYSRLLAEPVAEVQGHSTGPSLPVLQGEVPFDRHRGRQGPRLPRRYEAGPAEAAVLHPEGEVR